MRRFIILMAALLGLSLFGAATTASAAPVTEAAPSAPAAVPSGLDIPVAGPGDLSFPDQPGTGVVLSDAHRQARAELAMGSSAALAQSAASVPKWNPARGLKVVQDGAPSGHRPYGGDMWSGGTAAANKWSCSYGLSTRATSGAQYGYTAGHCSRADGVHDDINPTNGVFCVGFVGVCPSIDIGNTGHGGTCFGSCGDKMFIRANKAWLGNGLRREGRTFDSRTTVAIFAAGNPVVGEAMSCSCGISGKLIGSQVGSAHVSSTSANITFNSGVTAKVAVAFNQTGSPQSGCPQAGDSGGLIISGNHDALGVLSGHAQDLNGCWLFFGRAGDALTSVNQVPAPLP